MFSTAGGFTALAHAEIPLDSKRQNDVFVQRMTSVQSMLYSFIVSILPDTDAAQDVLQETNVVLLEKANEFRPELHFPTWACKIARFQVQAYLRDRGRNRMMFVGQLFDEIAEEAVAQLAEYKGRLEALERCLQKLPAHDKTLLEARYAEGGSVQALAVRENKTVNAISRTLYRLRGILLRCILQSLPAGGAA